MCVFVAGVRWFYHGFSKVLVAAAAVVLAAGYSWFCVVVAVMAMGELCWIAIAGSMLSTFLPAYFCGVGRLGGCFSLQ